jgi:hypothetical protein
MLSMLLYVTPVSIYGGIQPQTPRKTFQNDLYKNKLPLKALSKNLEFEIK